MNVLRMRACLVALVLAASTTAVVVGSGEPATAAPSGVPPVIARTSKTVTADPLPTAQINGVVYAQAVAKGVVFAGGSFSSARPAGAAAGVDEVVRSNLLAYDLKTGRLKSFAPAVNGQVKALTLSSDGKTLFVAGNFTKVGKSTRNRFAAFSVSSGKLTSLAPSFNSTVNALATTGSTVYAGGSFSTVSGNARVRLAAVSVTKKKLTGWAPAADATVQALVLTPDKKGVVVGGSFAKLNSSSAAGMGLLTAKDGKSKRWKINGVVKNYGQKAAVLSLVADKDTIYGSTFAYGGGNFEGVFAANPKDGAVRWLQDCHGDTYSVAPVGDLVYSVGHAHFCANIGGFPETDPETNYRALVVTKSARGTVAPNGQPGAHYGDFNGQPAPSLVNWFPYLQVGTYTGKVQAAWSITASQGYLLIGGEFLSADGVAQQGLVRFALPSVAPREQGPVLQDKAFAPSASVAGSDSITVTWPGNYDRDDLALGYEVLRDDVVVGTLTTKTPSWAAGQLSYTDHGLVLGNTYTYRIRVKDGDGNTVLSPEVEVLLIAPPSATSTPGAGPATQVR